MSSQDLSGISSSPGADPFLLGVEQEFQLFARGEKLDFRTQFQSVVASASSVRFRDHDTSVFLDAGYMLACDGQDAEFATAPVSALGEGSLASVREVSRCRAHMMDLLKKNGVEKVRGYSTHISISVPNGREWEIAEAMAPTAAPGLILLMEARGSPGLLIRPRRGRLEIGSEYIDDEDQLTAALVFLAGSVQAYLQDDEVWQGFPRVRVERWEQANIRPGIFLPHDAYGESMHDLSRAATLELECGERITAGELLTRCADLILSELNGRADPLACGILLAFARGERSLQIEREASPALVTCRGSYAPAPESNNVRMIVSASDSFGITPRFVDWAGVAFSLDDSEEPVIIGLPWALLPQFFNEAREKGANLAILQSKAESRALNSVDQLQSPQAYKEVDPATLGEQAREEKKSVILARPQAKTDSRILNSIDQLQTAQTYKQVDSAALGVQAREWKESKFILSPREPGQSAIPMTAKRPAWWLVVAVIAIVVVALGWWVLNRGSDQPAAAPVSVVPTSPAPTLVVVSPPTSVAPLSPAGKTVPVRIRVITSSDWTSVSFEDAEVSGITVKTASPEATMAGYDSGIGQFNLNQPIERSGEKAVEMVVDFALSMQEGGSVGFVIGRGHIGATTVNLYVVDGSAEVLIATFQWSGINPDARNLEKFVIDSSQFDATQNQAGITVSIRASFCSNDVGGITFNMPEPVMDVNEFHVVAEGKDLDCVIVDSRLACTGMTPASTESGTICKAGEETSAGCVDFTVQIPACQVKDAGGSGGQGGDEGGVEGGSAGIIGAGSNECPAGLVNYCDEPRPGEIPFCGCH